MSIAKNMPLKWYSSMKKKLERFRYFLTLKIELESQKSVLLDGLIYIICLSTKKLLRWKSAVYHSVKLPFDVEVAEKFLNGI